MATTTRHSFAKDHAKSITVVLSIVGYALVISAFAGVIPLFPDLSKETVILFSNLIAIVNTFALLTLLVGWRFIRNGEVRKHRATMLTAFVLICVFLVLYLWKVGGGFEKSLVIREGQFLAAYASIIEPLYLIMLAIHIILSVVAVPVVLYAVILGLTHTPAELTETAHARVGRIAVSAWSLSLFLGIVTYLLLNHVYSWEVLA
jgi:putative membrane protein